jgi:hypothetical protein
MSGIGSHSRKVDCSFAEHVRHTSSDWVGEPFDLVSSSDLGPVHLDILGATDTKVYATGVVRKRCETIIRILGPKLHINIARHGNELSWIAPQKLCYLLP